MESPTFILTLFGVASLLMSVVFLRYRFNLILNSYLILFCLAMFFNELLYLRLNPHQLDGDTVLLICSILFLYVIFMRFGSGLVAAVAGDEVDPTVAFCERVPDRVLLVVTLLWLVIKAYLVHKVGPYLAFNPGQARLGQFGHMGGFDQAMGVLIDAPALGVLVIAAVKVGVRPRRLAKMALLVGPILPLYLVGNQDAGARRTLLALTLMMLLTYFYVRDFRFSLRGFGWCLLVGYMLYLAAGYYQLIRNNFTMLYVEQHGHLHGLTISDVAKRILEPQQTIRAPTNIGEALQRNAAERSPYFELFLRVTQHELAHPSGAFGGKLFLAEIQGAIPSVFFRHKEVMNVKAVTAGRFGERITDLATTPLEEAVADFGLAGIALVPFLFLFTYIVYRWILVHVSPSSWLVGPAIVSVMLNLALSFEASQAIFLPLRSVILLWILGLPMWVLKQLLYPPWGSAYAVEKAPPPNQPR